MKTVSTMNMHNASLHVILLKNTQTTNPKRQLLSFILFYRGKKRVSRNLNKLPLVTELNRVEN